MAPNMLSCEKYIFGQRELLHHSTIKTVYYRFNKSRIMIYTANLSHSFANIM